MNVVYLSKSQLQSRQDASDTPAADLYITSQDSLMKMKKENMLVPYASAQTDTALNLFKDEECYWTGLWVDPVVFAVNEDYAGKHPAFSYSWNEVLTRSSLRLSMTDFVAADMAEDLLMCLAEHFGIGETFSLLGKAQNHIVQYGKYLSTPSRMAGMGKCDIGISGLNEAVRSRQEKLPVVIMYPEDGSPWYLFGAGISADAAYPNKVKIHRPSACLFRNISQGRAKTAGGNDKVRPGEGMTEGFFHAVGIIPYHRHISHRIAMLIQESSQPLGIFISNFSQKKLRPGGNNFSNHRFSWKVRFFPQ